MEPSPKTACWFLVLVALPVSCCVSTDKYDAAIAERDAAQERVRGLEAELTERQTQVEELQTQVGELKQLEEIVALYRSENNGTGLPTVDDVDPLTAEYAKLIEIDITSAKYIRTYTKGRVPGLRFRVKNNGARTIERLVVVVFFLDVNDAPIGEEEISLITNFGMFSDTGLLKSNYSMKIPDDPDEYRVSPHITSEWKPGNVQLVIKEIQFPDTESEQ